MACLDEVRAAAKDVLSDDELEALVEQLQRRRVNRAKGDLDSVEEAMLREADDMVQTVVEAAQIEKRNRYLNIMARRRVNEFIANFDDPAKGLRSYLVGTAGSTPGSRLSIDARSKAIAHEYIGGILADLRRAEVLEHLNSRDIDLDIAREMWELDKPDGQPGKTGNTPARQIAEVFHKYQQASVARQNRAGAWIKPLPGYIVRQSHDSARLRRAGFEEWRDFVLPRLDLQRTLGGADNVEEFLQAAYTNIVSGRHGRTRGAEGAGDKFLAFKGPANMAKKVSAERVLHFKDADSWFTYNERFGGMNLAEGVFHGLERQARNTALMEGLGTNPRTMFDDILNELKDRHKGEPKTLEALNKQAFRWFMDELDGTTNIPGSVPWARAGSTWRAIESMSKLGGATLSSFADVAAKAAELRYQGVGLLEAYGNSLQDVLGRAGTPQARETAELIGEGFDGMLGSVLARFSATDNIPGRMAKAQQRFFKLSLMNWWTDAHKRGTVLMMSRHLAMNRNQAMNDLPERLREVLSLYMTPEQWDVFRTRAVRKADGKEYLTPDAVRELSDTEVRQILDKPQASERQVRRYRDELETAVRAYFTDRADFAIPTPGARERAWLKAGTRPGTPEGEAMRFFSQFKSFPITYVSKVLGRERHGYQGKASMRGMAHIIVASTVMGYLAMSAKDISKGRTPRDPSKASTWGASFVQGGGAGIYGDFLMGEANRFGQGALDTFMGPTFGSATSLADIMYRMRDGEDAAAQAFRFAKNHTPYINLFYTRAALDYLVLYEIQEMMNPGYLQRMERRVREENNQTFMISPSQAVR